ncbi:hypothetical protein Hneap_1341 [Halothiobacillus neapolitanus c2]|uniref:Uncharacterized protein n=1 Tax=Halothiobacillus neapolitanus (strain ATCC 23641 / DSM 15147 / CIP 104769 / NCIMB 8539 / c2) TaxID=555778 RepID=D0L0F2_HALNC|nr:hypothetical protein Hneap_1341 [Halothiobacillus neapolitanus c2]
MDKDTGLSVPFSLNDLNNYILLFSEGENQKCEF